jgi:bifunctional non-homologous end joining protein LigD
MKSDPLSAYRAKRSPDRTPEPFGAATEGPGGLFVLHKHAARRLHWDLRLELDGVLRSWAVPKGPSFDQRDKRLAVQVEDHPLEYADFEGLIPEGNYGAGGVIVWDRGLWIPVEDPHEGLRKGKLLFDLRGYKMRGRWTLVKLKKGEKEWLLIKERDAWLRTEGGTDIPDESVLSGLTVDELKAGQTPAALVRAELERLKVPKRPVAPSSVSPMLAEPRDEAFTREGWVFELKLDGYRLIAAKSGDRPLLRSRNGGDLTGTFPEVARAVQALPVSSAVLDGEVVVLNGEGQPSFGLLQQRARLTRQLDVRRASIESPATFFVFDLLGFEDFDLRSLPLVERKRLLRRLLPPLGALRYLEHFETEGEKLLEQVTTRGLEGIVAKKADAPYRAGRGPAWLKIRADRTGDFVVVGFTPPKGSRDGFGALLLADYVDGRLVYAGRAGSGFTGKQIKEVFGRLKQKVRPTPASEGPVVESSGESAGPKDGRSDASTKPKKRSAGSPVRPTDWTKSIPDLKASTWVEPELVCEVRFTEWTKEGLLRHPVFVRFRDDKAPSECVRQGGRTDGQTDKGSRGLGENDQNARKPGQRAEATDRPSVRPSVRPPAGPPAGEVKLTNLDKIYWPDEGYTKGDLLAYHKAAAPWLLPYLRDRPLVLTRYPDGINGKSFYQKDAPGFAPDWIRTVPIWSEETQREIRYFVCESVEALLYLVNLGTIPLHLWASRVSSLERPDWCVLDLDPKEAPFSDVVTVAKVLHDLCETVGLPNFVKTTGKTGLHVLLPLGGQCTYEQSRTLGELLARLVIQQLPDITTITRQVGQRGAKVYLDYLQNRHGQTIVAPFSVRPLPGATVSMPLLWKEVNAKLNPRDYTIKNAVKRMEKLGEDPVAPVLTVHPDLTSVLAQLAGLMSKSAKPEAEQDRVKVRGER